MFNVCNQYVPDSNAAAPAEAAGTAAEDPVSPSNTAADALVAHAEEVTAGTANAEDPVSPSNAAAEALAAHAHEACEKPLVCVEGGASAPAAPAAPAEPAEPAPPSNEDGA
eukprot:Skav203970  [mRNA]  locus=scaffold94:410905:418233:- [translate_table: standard]